jgi:hypothetical protein
MHFLVCRMTEENSLFGNLISLNVFFIYIPTKLEPNLCMNLKAFDRLSEVFQTYSGTIKM